MTAEPTAAEICQRHIDSIESARKPGAVRSFMTDELVAAVLDLLYLTRNTDETGRENRAEIDAELERIRKRDA